MSKYYLQSGNYETIVDGSDPQVALRKAFMRIFDMEPPLPVLGDIVFLGERGYAIDLKNNIVRKEPDVFAVNTKEILIATGLDKLYHPIDIPNDTEPPPEDNSGFANN